MINIFMMSLVNVSVKKYLSKAIIFLYNFITKKQADDLSACIRFILYHNYLWFLTKLSPKSGKSVNKPSAPA